MTFVTPEIKKNILARKTGKHYEMSSSNYFFKTSEPEFFVQCQWKSDIDFTKKDDYTVALVIITDTDGYWQAEVTRDLLLEFQTPNIESSRLELLLKSAFQGLNTFDDRQINWKINKTSTGYELILQCRFDSILLMRIGSLYLKRVPNSEIQLVKKGWFDNTTHQLTKYQQEKASYNIYAKSLEESNRQLKEEMNEMILRKNDTEMELMLKFKEVLNTKKLKIRRLISKNNDFGVTPAPIPAITNKQPRSRKKRSVVHQTEEKEPEPEIKSDPIVEDANDEYLFDVFEIDRTAPF